MKDLLIAVVIVLVAVTVLWSSMTICRRKHPAWETLKRYRYAHRGYHDKPTIPENSMAAFRRAVEHGWGAELDVHLMKDGNLAVIHDSSLKRTAGADICIEDLTAPELEQYDLEESSEIIPLLPEVLALFEGKTPLIIELKSERGNHAELSEAVAKLLDTYKGDYCIESFDYKVVQWFRKNRPDVFRGQLAYDYYRSEKKMSGWQQFYRTNLWSNIFTKPDFVAYKFEHRDATGLFLCQLFHRPVTVYWTLRKKEDLLTAERENAGCIFECFDPGH